MSTLKINWGTRILLLYAGFVMLIVTLVYKSMRTDFDLVSNDYYNEELKYQDIIDAGKNQSRLSAPVQIDATVSTTTFHFPAEFDNTKMKGTAHFYSAVNQKWDKLYSIEIVNGNSIIYTNDLKPASYLVKLHWTNNDLPYYQETSIDIN